MSQRGFTLSDLIPFLAFAFQAYLFFQIEEFEMRCALVGFVMFQERPSNDGRQYVNLNTLSC